MDKNIAIILHSLYNSLTDNIFNKDNGEDYDINLYQFNNLMSVVSENDVLMDLVIFYGTVNQINVKNENVALTLLNNLLDDFQTKYSYEQYCNAQNKLNSTTLNVVENDLVDFYSDLGCVIENTYRGNNNININELSLSLEKVLKYLTNNKNINTQNTLVDDDFNNLISDFNSKYIELDVEDRNILNHFFDSTYDDDKILFGRLKDETIVLIEELLNKSNDESMISRLTNAKEKINNMEVDESNILDEIIKLYDLKNFLNL